MAVGRETAWNVQTDGDDTNGGGFNTASAGTDYSQQAAAQLSLTDCATSGTTVTTLTSATGGFTSAMVGNVINLSAGTNLLEDWYEITAYTDTNTVTLDRAPDDGVGGVSGATGKVGGALGSPGILSDLGTAAEDGNTFWIKSGTYTLTTATDGSGGPVNLGTGFYKSIVLFGYNSTYGDLADTYGSANRPVINCGTVGSITVVQTAGSSSRSKHMGHLVVDGNDQTAIIAFSCVYGIQTDCKAINFTTRGFSGGSVIESCEAIASSSGATYGFVSGDLMRNCISSGSTYGYYLWSASEYAVDCIAFDCVSYGFYCNSFNTALVNCVAYGNTSHGFGLLSQTHSAVNCHSESNGGYGYKDGTGTIQGTYLVNCSDYKNTSGRTDGDNSLRPFWDVNPIVEADFVGGSPLVDPVNGDYGLNATPGAGLLLRSRAKGIPGQTQNNDIGAVQHADTPGGSTGFYYLTHFIDDTDSQLGFSNSPATIIPEINEVGASAWSYLAGTGWILYGNRLYTDGTNEGSYGGLSNLNMAGFDSKVSDCKFGFVVWSSGSHATGLIFRRNPGDDSFYLLWAYSDDLYLYWYDGTSGSLTALETIANVYSINNFNFIEVRLSGTECKVYANGTLEHTETLVNGNDSETGAGIYTNVSSICPMFAVYDKDAAFSTLYPPATVARGVSVPHPLAHT